MQTKLKKKIIKYLYKIIIRLRVSMYVDFKFSQKISDFNFETRFIG